MKSLFPFLLILVLLSCSKSFETKEDSGSEDVVLYDTTIINSKKNFTIQLISKNYLQDFLVVKSESDTLLKDSLDSNPSDISMIDFNKDGNTDIMLTYPGNNFTYTLYMFDASTATFKTVDGFENYPESISLKADSSYYYSYHRAGCADMNWESDLFRIENFKTLLIGHIYGQGCEDDPSQKIEIFKITKNNMENKKLQETLPYVKTIPEFGDKWAFIEKYWNKNYKNF